MCDLGKKLLPPLKEKQQLSVKLTRKEKESDDNVQNDY